MLVIVFIKTNPPSVKADYGPGYVNVITNGLTTMPISDQ